MLFTHCTYLRIVNNTSSAMRITVDETDNFDWDRDGNSRPDINFQNVSIGAYQSKKEREELNALARSSWYRMHITLSNGNSINFRNDQYDARRPNEREYRLEGADASKYSAQQLSGNDLNTFIIRTVPIELMLIITNKDKLKNKYGQYEFDLIEAKIKEYMQALDRTGTSAKLVYIDDVISLSPYLLSPVNPDSPQDIKGLIDNLDEKLNPRFFLILGGHSIIPFHELDNPVYDPNNPDLDPDRTVFSDNPYASKDNDYWLPERAMGRFPDAASNEPSFFISVLEAATSRVKNAKKYSFGQTAIVWNKASQVVFDPIKNVEDLKDSPPIRTGDVRLEWLNKKGYLYFNLHGTEDENYPNWYGEDENKNYCVAFKPENIREADVENAVVCCEACYGANIVDRGVNNALSLKFLDRGAACFMGSTKIAFGQSTPPISCADILVQKFFERIKGGFTFGDAFLKAKEDFIVESIATNAGLGLPRALSAEDLKTLIEFVMFADPSSIMQEEE